MRQATTLKTFVVTDPAAIVDNAGFTTAAIDTKGFGHCSIFVRLGALDIAIAVFKVTESDDSGMSGATDVPGADFSVLPAVLPAATADNSTYAIHISLRGKRKRYLDLQLTGGDGSAGTYADAWCVLSEPEIYPVNAVDRGLAAELTV
jgi:hypothetical protein